MKVIREEWRKGETCFGGGSGTIIPFRPKSTEFSTKSSASEAQDSALPKNLIDQLNQEAREQWGYQPETDESEPSDSEN